MRKGIDLNSGETRLELDLPQNVTVRCSQERMGELRDAKVSITYGPEGISRVQLNGSADAPTLSALSAAEVEGHEQIGGFQPELLVDVEFRERPGAFQSLHARLLEGVSDADLLDGDGDFPHLLDLVRYRIARAVQVIQSEETIYE